MRIFVTGGTGFLGKHFLEKAMVAGHDCTSLVRNPPDKNSRQSRILAKALDHVTSDDLNGVDALVHFASAGVSPQPVTWDQAIDVNVRQSLHLIETAEKAGVEKILLCGSCFEYGRSGERFEFIPPDAPLEPVGPYGTSKAAFSLAAAAYARSSKSSIVLLRPFHLFGEGQHASNFWPALRKAALTGEDFPMTPGEQIRDFQPVQETASDFLQTLSDWQATPGEMKIRNLGSGNPTTLYDFASRWWHHWNATGSLLPHALDYRPGEVMRFVPLLTH